MEESIMVLSESRPHLTSLAKLAPQLNEATDRLTAEIKAIEEELQQMNLGVEVESDAAFKTSPTEEERDEYEQKRRWDFEWSIAYERVGKGWWFTVRHYRVDKDDDNEEWTLLDTTLLTAASRDLRIAAAEAIPALLKKIEKTVNAKIAALSKVADH